MVGPPYPQEPTALYRLYKELEHPWILLSVGVLGLILPASWGQQQAEFSESRKAVSVSVFWPTFQGWPISTIAGDSVEESFSGNPFCTRGP